mgnify:CR=1 FL=1
MDKSKAKRERKLEAIRVVDILRDQGLDLADIYGVMADIAEVLAETAAQGEEETR